MRGRKYTLKPLMYLLDTNIVSELRKPRPHGGVVAWIASIPDADLHINVVTLGEMQLSINKNTMISARSDQKGKIA